MGEMCIRDRNRCVFLFPQSDDISGGLPQGIGFGEREIYILAKEYFFAKAVLLKAVSYTHLDVYKRQQECIVNIVYKV